MNSKFIEAVQNVLHKKIQAINLGGDSEFIRGVIDSPEKGKMLYVCREVSFLIEAEKGTVRELSFLPNAFHYEEFGSYDYVHFRRFQYPKLLESSQDLRSRIAFANRSLLTLNLPPDTSITSVEIYGIRAKEEVALDDENPQITTTVDISLDLGMRINTSAACSLFLYAHKGRTLFSIYFKEEAFKAFLKAKKSFGILTGQYEVTLQNVVK